MKTRAFFIFLIGCVLILDGCQQQGPVSNVVVTTATSLRASEDINTSSPSMPVDTGTPDISLLTPTPALTEIPVQVGSDAQSNSPEILLLYNSGKGNSFDGNFCKLVEYYGAICRKYDLHDAQLTEQVLRDSNGAYYKLVGLNARTVLNKNSALLSVGEMAILKSVIHDDGLNLLVGNITKDVDAANLMQLTNNVVHGIEQPQDSNEDWIISSSAPEITSVFSGQTIVATGTPQTDVGLLIADSATVTTLISSTDNSGQEYPIFIRWTNGAGSVYVYGGDAGEVIADNNKLAGMYYDTRHFSNVVPLMLAIRHVMGNEVWHNSYKFANLTIDDATLTQVFGTLSYPVLLQQMETHDFHTTIATIPAQWQLTDPNVAYIFFTHPDRFSLVQHGNNHDGYEFYKYALGPGDPTNDPDFRARPLSEQKADIVQGLQRMTEMSKKFALPFDRVMVFPYGISPAPTLSILKEYNYLATVSSEDIPLGESSRRIWDFGMYPAQMNYEDFPVLTRRQPGSYLPFRPNIQPFLFDLFLGKPALFYSHANGRELFAEGIQGFNVVADQMNGLVGGVKWKSLGYILTHLYLEKTNADGSLDVLMYTNKLVVTNNTDREVNYHVSKKETLNVPISKLSINGRVFPYSMKDNHLRINVLLPAHATMEIAIQY